MVARAGVMTPRQKKYHKAIPERFRRMFSLAWRGDKPLTAIRAYCVQCMAWQPGLVRGCTIETCPLYGYRMGKKL
jgi:hypothetical protein